jgi:hypothetical protein
MLVIAFLRGVTNLPPKDRLFRVAPWKAKGRSIDVVVPTRAQQALPFDGAPLFYATGYARTMFRDHRSGDYQ